MSGSSDDTARHSTVPSGNDSTDAMFGSLYEVKYRVGHPSTDHGRS
jgi:hypothetical protein